MANLFVRSTTGNDSNDGLTWATAKATLAGAAAIDGNGDTIYVSKDHSETLTANTTIGIAGVWNSAPNRVLCVDDTGNPATPTTLATTAVISGGGLYSISFINSGFFHIYGVSFTNITNFTIGHSSDQSIMHIIEESTISRVANGGSAFAIGQNGTSRGPSRVLLKNVWTSQGDSTAIFSGGVAWFKWVGGGVLAGSSRPTRVSSFMGGAVCHLEGLDLTRLTTNARFLDIYNGESGWGYAKYCRMPSDWAYNGISDSSNPNSRQEVYCCNNNANVAIYGAQDVGGTSITDNTIFRVGGATDYNKTKHTVKVVTLSSNDRFYKTHTTLDMYKWNDLVGVPLEISVELLTNNVTLTAADVQLEVTYSNTSTAAYGNIVSTKPLSLTAPANLTTSNATWVASGYTTPIRQKVATTITPTLPGDIIVRLIIGKPSLTMHYCPKLEVRSV